MHARRLWITGPYEVTVQPYEVAEEPGPGQVLLEITHSLVSAGTELAIVMGTHIGFTTGAAWPRYPMALGYAAAGRVLACGAGVTALATGDRVVTAAPHASHALLDVESASLLPVPAGCPPEDALLAHLAAIPLNGLRLAAPKLGEGMIVFGQGLIGALAARLGRLSGCRPVLGVDPLPLRRQLAEDAGIVPVNPTAADPAAAHRDLAGGRLPEIVIEATGAPAVIDDALRAAGEMARVVLLGSPRGRVEIDPYTQIHRRGIALIGAHANVAPAVATPYNPFTAQRNRQVALALIADGSLSTRGLVSHHIAPEEVHATYRALAERGPAYMGVVIDWTR